MRAEEHECSHRRRRPPNGILILCTSSALVYTEVFATNSVVFGRRAAPAQVIYALCHESVEHGAGESWPCARRK